jgi:hypothetical protein
MKNITTLFLLLAALSGYAQKFPDFKPLRYDEDYHLLHNDSLHRDWYKKLKYLPITRSGSIFVSFGGDIRYQYFYVKNEDWGEAPKDNDGYILSRLLLHADFHVGDRFRIFVQTQSSQANGKLSVSPVDDDPLEVHQAFADFALLAQPKNKLTIRLGRQEMSFGSQRLVAVRDGPNNRQSFDAAKLIYDSKNFRADAFYSHYVQARDGIFDDKSIPEKKLWGSYFVFRSVPVIQNVDVYYLGYERDRANFDDGAAKEQRHSTGTRLWGKISGWRYDAEAVYQFGKFGDTDISAWTASVNTGYRFSNWIAKPEIGLKGEFVSGDKKYDDGKLQTFNPLFPRGAYFGLAALIGPSNLIDAHPSVSFELSRNLDWTVDYDAFWRYSANDGLYAPNVSLIYSGRNSTSKDIGQQLSSDIVWNMNEFVYLRGEVTWFDSGKYLKETGPGKNIFFAGVTLQFKF